MAKKSSLPLVYLIGMAIVCIGFICPMFSLGGFAATNGFQFINFGKSGFVSIAALLIIAGAVGGVVLSLISVKNAETLRLVCLAVSVLGGIILIVGFNQNAVYKVIAKGFLKCAAYGFYFVLAGWIVAAIGYFLKK